jgi:hypothetical protein
MLVQSTLGSKVISFDNVMEGIYTTYEVLIEDGM